jgi:hypothetical protein
VSEEGHGDRREGDDDFRPAGDVAGIAERRLAAVDRADDLCDVVHPGPARRST